MRFFSRFFGFILLIIASGAIKSHANSLSDSTSIYKLGFFDLTAGLDSRVNRIKKFQYDITPSKSGMGSDTLKYFADRFEYSVYSGVFFRIQTSFFAMYFNDKWKKIAFGDIISVEISAGFVDSRLSAIKSGAKIFYNCEFGFGLMYRPSTDIDIGLTVILLKFGNDFLSNLYSGSSYFLKLRAKRLIGEVGWISENKLYFGRLNLLVKDENLSKLSLSVKYFFKPTKNFGIRYEIMPVTYPYYSPIGEEGIMSLKLFYGVNF